MRSALRGAHAFARRHMRRLMLILLAFVELTLVTLRFVVI